MYLEKACGLVMYFITSISFFSLLIWFRQIPSRQSEENEEGTHENKTCFPHMKLVFTFIYIHKMFCGFFFRCCFAFLEFCGTEKKFFPRSVASRRRRKANLSHQFVHLNCPVCSASHHGKLNVNHTCTNWWWHGSFVRRQKLDAHLCCFDNYEDAFLSHCLDHRYQNVCFVASVIINWVDNTHCLKCQLTCPIGPRKSFSLSRKFPLPKAAQHDNPVAC